MAPERRGVPRYGWVTASRSLFRGCVREVVWCVDLDDNDTGDPSLLKVMSAAFAVLAVLGPFKDAHTLNGWHVAMAFLAACTYLGYRGLRIYGAAKGFSGGNGRDSSEYRAQNADP